MFDVKAEIELTLPSPDGDKTVLVRFPTDEEWIERQKSRRTIIRQLGRGMTETDVRGGEEADAALLASIRVGEGPELDPYEAARVIDRIGQADVEDVRREANSYRVALRVPGGETVHLLKMPTQRQIMEYRRSFVRLVDLPYGHQELRINMAAAGALYDELAEAAEGYAGAVPIVHKVPVLQAVIQELEMEIDGGADFFSPSGPSGPASGS